MRHVFFQNRREDAYVNVTEIYRDRRTAITRLAFNLYLINVVLLKDYKIKIVSGSDETMF